jgi:hypothetical protein
MYHKIGKITNSSLFCRFAAGLDRQDLPRYQEGRPEYL